MSTNSIGSSASPVPATLPARDVARTNEHVLPDGVRLNDFFLARAVAPRLVARCPGCEAPGPWRPFMLVRGERGNETEGVVMPSVRCGRCTLVFLSPRLSATEVAAVYRENARLATYFTSGAKAERDRGAGFLPFARRLEKTLEPTERELLDLGCGAGAFMRLMAARGFSVTGAEINPAAAALARAAGLDVRTAEFDDAVDTLAREGRRFDVITLIHTLEHLPDPLRALRRLRSILRDDGAVAINVPNVRSFLAPVDRLLGTGVASIWDPVGHYSYFSWRSLQALCARASFRVVARDCRLLVAGRSGALGILDDVASAACRRLGGTGSNITIIARKQRLLESAD